MSKTCKKVLSVAVISLLTVSVFALVSTAFGRGGGGGVINNPIINLLNTIIDSLNSWFGPGGKYSYTPQVDTGQVSIEGATGSVGHVHIGKVANVKITIYSPDVDEDEWVWFGYDIGEWPPGKVLEVVTWGEPGVKTFEVCTDHFWIEVVGTVTLHYNYIITTEP